MKIKRIPIETLDRKTRPKYRQIILKNNQSDLEATMICLLSKFCPLEFKKPQKAVTVSKEFLTLKYIKFPREKFNVREWKRRRYENIKKCMMEEERISGRCFQHRLEQINRREMTHLLEDILLQYGVFVFIEREENNGISGDSNIYYKGATLHKFEYVEIAERVRKYIRQKMESKRNISLEKGELLQCLPEEKCEIVRSIK